MHVKWVFKHFSSRVQGRVPRLAIVWALSLLAGIFLCASASIDPYDTFCAIFSEPPSLFGRFLVYALPVASVIGALHSPLFALSCIVVFLWGFSHGFCGFAICTAISDAAWLLHPLLLFSASCSSVLMWLIILRGRTKSCIHKIIRLAVILCCVFYSVDLFIVSPLVSNLSKYF